ncbi:MAG: DNA primase [Erysipelotrichaceae bacterium]|nr:DNA primase [Erysipelotrichaceae bacterium]
MARVTDRQIEEIRSKARIEDVIGHYEEVHRIGSRNWKCICPFHDDHDPSMTISLDKQIFKCFVCGAGGNVFQFVMKKENITFVESVYKVAEQIGYPLDPPEEKVERSDPYRNLHKVLEESVRFSQYQLQSAEAADKKNYLLKRGMSEEEIQYYQIGYFPRQYPLHEFLRKKGYSVTDMVESNVVNVNETGLHDVFYERISIPIHDEYGQPVGFTARTLDPNDDRKYINTTGTAIYQKSCLVYNYHRAKEEINREKCVIITEGPMDLFAFSRIGIKNVVATLGTACTKEQVALIKKLCKKVILGYDGDTAGQNAIYKAGNLMMDAGLEVLVLNNPTDLDPDEIIAQKGKDALKAMVNQPKLWIEFVYQYLYKRTDLKNYSQRRDFASMMSLEIQRTKNATDKSIFMDRLSMDTGFRIDQLQSMAIPQYNPQPVEHIVQQPKKKTLDGRLIAEYQVLSQVLLSRRQFTTFQDELGFLPTEQNQKIVVALMEYYRSHEAVQLADFLTYLNDETLQGIIVELESMELISFEINEDILKGAIRRIKLSLIDERIQMLKTRITSTQDEALKAQLGLECVSLMKQKQQI